MYTKTGTPPMDAYVAEYAPLVKRVAHHMLAKLPANIQVDDLIQAGMIGLMDAVDRFEEAHGVKFETFASQRIRGAMLDELRAGDWLPRSVRRSQRTVEGAIRSLEQKISRPPRGAEIADELGLDITQYHELLSNAKGAQLFSYDDSDDDDDNFLSRGAGDVSSEPSAMLTDKRFKLALVAAIENLPDREKTLMGLYYEQDLNMREIAAIMSVTESRVCQLHSQAVARIRCDLKGW